MERPPVGAARSSGQPAASQRSRVADSMDRGSAKETCQYPAVWTSRSSPEGKETMLPAHPNPPQPGNGSGRLTSCPVTQTRSWRIAASSAQAGSSETIRAACMHRDTAAHMACRGLPAGLALRKDMLWNDSFSPSYHWLCNGSDLGTTRNFNSSKHKFEFCAPESILLVVYRIRRKKRNLLHAVAS